MNQIEDREPHDNDLMARSDHVMVDDCLEEDALGDSSGHTFASQDPDDDDDLEIMHSNSRVVSDSNSNLDYMFNEEESNRSVESSPLECDGDGMRDEPIQVRENEVGIEASCVDTNTRYNAQQGCRFDINISSHSMPQIEINKVAYPEAVSYNHQQYQRRLSCNDISSEYDPRQYQRPSSCIDLDMMDAMPYPCTTPSSNVSRPNSHPLRRVTLSPVNVNDGRVHQEVSYEEALQKLADSIMRTEQSRQQLMMMRPLMGRTAPPQCSQYVASSACEQLQQRVADRCASAHLLMDAYAAVAEPVVSARHPSIEYSSEVLPNDRFAIYAAFFSGSRDTLTDGLESSRSQLKLYLDQINQAL